MFLTQKLHIVALAVRKWIMIASAKKYTPPMIHFVELVERQYSICFTLLNIPQITLQDGERNHVKYGLLRKLFHRYALTKILLRAFHDGECPKS